MLNPMSEITQLLSQVEDGDPAAADQLLPLVYTELRKLAEISLAREAPGQTLQPTALVHEAFLRLVGSHDGSHDGQQWNGRAHFFGAAAQAMRRILVEQARRKKSLKAGGDRDRQALVEFPGRPAANPLELLALHEALLKLAERDARKAKLVELRFFAGLTNQEAAAALGISTTTANEDWRYARSWLRVEMEGGGSA